MTKIGKALVVFVAVMSLAFLAFVGATTVAGPNWEAHASEIDEYAFEQTGADPPQWKVTHRQSGKDLGSKSYFPQAIVSAQNDLIPQQQQRITQLDGQIAAVQQTLEAEKSASAVDEKGIEIRLTELAAMTDQLDKQVLALTRRVTETAQQAEQIRSEAAERRADVARLQAELAQVRTDRFRVANQIEQLEQRLIRLDGQIDRAERRQDQLQERTSGYESGG